jgi:hypothetical protein
MGGTQNNVEQTATVPIGTFSDAVKLAPDVCALKRLLAPHGLDVDGLIDYWARESAGPGMNCEDVINIGDRLKKLCPQQFKDMHLPDEMISMGTGVWTVPFAPCASTIQGYVLQADLPNNEETRTLLRRRLARLAQKWSRGDWKSDGLRLTLNQRLEIINYYRAQPDGNAFATLGLDVADKIAYGFLAQIKVTEPEGEKGRWRQVRERLHDLEIPTQGAARSVSQVPYSGILGAAINLQNAAPSSTTGH